MPRAAQYFVSSGFAFVHADSTTDVCAVEAVPLEQLDHDAVKQARARARVVRAASPHRGSRAAAPRLAAHPNARARCRAAQGLADYQAKLMNAKDDYEKAAAQVGIEVCSAMNSALGG